MSNHIHIATIISAVGLNGFMQIKTFCHTPEDIISLAPLFDAQSRQYNISKYKKRSHNTVVIKFHHITSREDAERLKGVKLFVERSTLPELEAEQFYYVDLCGLEVRLSNGTVLGTVKCVHNFGASDILEIIKVNNDRNTVYYPFAEHFISKVSLADNCLIIKDVEEI